VLLDVRPAVEQEPDHGRVGPVLDHGVQVVVAVGRGLPHVEQPQFDQQLGGGEVAFLQRGVNEVVGPLGQVGGDGVRQEFLAERREVAGPAVGRPDSVRFLKVLGESHVAPCGKGAERVDSPRPHVPLRADEKRLP
jgi:hypothetical protein